MTDYRTCVECRHYEKRHDEFPCVNCDSRTDYFNAEINPWIPCSERLPEEGKYLVTISYSFFEEKREMVYMMNYGYEWDGASEMCFHEWDEEMYNCWKPEVTAWMPLPEPYKGE